MADIEDTVSPASLSPASSAQAERDAALERIDLALDSGAILGTWVWDIPTDRFTADERFARTFGFDPARCAAGVKLGEVTTVIHPEDFPRVETAIAETIAQGGRYNIDYRVRKLDGTYRWVIASGRCDHDPQGNATRFPGVLVDIDQRRQTEDRLRASEAEAREATRLLRAVIEAVPALIYVKDREGRLRIANQPVLDLVGKPWAQVENRTDLEILDDRAQATLVMQTDRAIMQAGGTSELEEIVGYDAFGARTFLSHKTAFRNESGDVIGLVGTSVDITARKRAAQAVADSERRLRRVLDNLFAFVGICDLDGTLLEANRAPVDGAGLVYTDIIGHPVWDTYWFAHDPTVQNQLRDAVALARTGQTVRLDLRVRWRDDTRILIDFQLAPLRNEAGDIVQLVPSGVDITAREEARARLEEALEQRQLLIRELNHRVKNLFAVMSGMIRATARECTTAADLAERLRGRILALARTHELIQPAMAAEFNQQSVGLDELIATILSPHLGTNSARLRLQGPPLLVAPNAATALALTLHELATNATKYGALAAEDGTIEATWSHDPTTLTLIWSEQGGPPVAGPPARSGFGTHLARLSADRQLAGAIEFDWRPQGVRIILTASLARVAGG